MTEQEASLVSPAYNRNPIAKEYLATGLLLIGWIATLSYKVGTLTQRLDTLEMQITATMQSNVANERFSSLQGRVDEQEKHLEYDDSRLDVLRTHK